ncbi:penicillin-binding protein 1A [Marinicella sp. S1101]|uniref:penicillin-binding protein 1A n=1 Tax=Marinicella marina TaxID=2996016 RepID=UPI0022608C81|nr:penicillin-binding protein 1A [Marinicella marina]MCX7554535.1 penicillin-binding protein 1A [Marinicella marina]
MTKLGLLFALLGVVMVYALYKYYEPELPSVESIKEYRMQVPLRVFSEDGKLISVFGTKRRIPASIDEIPLQLKQAYIAAEDASFYSHPGFDIKGILRAVWQIATTGKKQGGGSTITQQLTRNVFLTLDQTWTRKIKELFLAVKLERTISKDEILELYLNKIALGHRSYGVAAAAEVYYGKTLDELTLAQSAMLAAPPKAPSRINPVTSPERALQRRDYVLGRMLELDFITQAEYDEAINEADEAYVHEPVVELNAPWVAEMVRAELVELFGNDAYTDGYDVYTTIHSEKQLAAEQALQQGLHAYDRRHGYRGPIQQYDLSALDSTAENPANGLDLEKITEDLNGFPKPAGLQAALVLEVDAENALARLGDGQDIALSFATAEWAVPYVDNYRVGDKPKDLTEVLNVGDVVMVKRGDSGEFELSQIPDVQGALVSVHPDDGSIYALVGGFDYYLSKFNRATQAKRQPGSGFKPIVYSAALQNGLNAASIINDAPIVFEDDRLERTWRPENYSEKFFGPTRLREGIVKSRNLVSIRVLREIGIRNGRSHILDFGFNPDDVPADLSIALGSPNVPIIDMTRAYSVFANGGYLIQPYMIKTISNQAGETVYQANPVQVCDECSQQEAIDSKSISESVGGLSAEELLLSADQNDNMADVSEPTIIPAPRIIPAANQFIVESFMKDVINRGTGVKAKVLERADLAGKTGTTNDQMDGWFHGYQRNVVTNVWVGFDTPTPMGRGEVGGRVALPIWIDYMRVALAGEDEYQRPIPAGLIQAKINPKTGKLLPPGEAGGLREYFMVGQLPEEETVEDKPEYDDLF